MFYNFKSFKTLFTFCSQLKGYSGLKFTKCFIRIANREDPKQSDLGLHFLSVPFWKATSV